MSKNIMAPPVRLQGFTEPWEQCKLGEIGTTFSGLSGKAKEDFGHGEAQFVTYKNVYLNAISDSSMTERVEIDDHQNKVQYGDVFFTTSSETPDEVGMSSVWFGSKDNTYLNSFCFGFRPTKEIDPYYMAFMLRSDIIRRKIIILAQGISRYNLSKKQVMKIAVPLPELSEQYKIGAYLQSLDRLITLHQHKLELQKKLKAFFLQNMFPEEGETVPRIRFKGFTGDWEQRKFADLATVRRGLTYKPHNVIEGGKRVLRSSNINENTFQVHNDDVFVDENVVNIPCVNNGDILITSANGSSRLIGKHAIIRDIPENSAVHGGFMLLASSDESEFVNALMSSLWYTKFINAYVAGGNGAIGNLNKNDLDKQIAYVPQKEEMHKIGDFFGNLDHLITLHQRKIDQLQAMKKFMLQNLFV